MNLLLKPILLLCSVASAVSTPILYDVSGYELVSSSHNEPFNVLVSSPNYSAKQLSNRRKRSELGKSDPTSIHHDSARYKKDNPDGNGDISKRNVKNEEHGDEEEVDIIIYSHEIDREMKDFEKMKTIDEVRGAVRPLVRAKLKLEKLAKQNTILKIQNTILKINLTAALEDAGFSEFLLHICTKSEIFEEQMMVHTGFYGDPQFKKTEYESLIWKKLEGRDPPKAGEGAQLPPELSNGTHYRKLILILHFADERVSMQLKLLKDLLGRTREAYHRYAMAHQRLNGIWSKDPHGKLLNLKYIKRDNLDYYISLLSEELQWGVKIFVLSELTGGIVTNTTVA